MPSSIWPKKNKLKGIIGILCVLKSYQSFPFLFHYIILNFVFILFIFLIFYLYSTSIYYTSIYTYSVHIRASIIVTLWVSLAFEPLGLCFFCFFLGSICLLCLVPMCLFHLIILYCIILLYSHNPLKACSFPKIKRE